MKENTKKHSTFFRGFVLAVALLLAVLCFPLNGLVALAEDPPTVENYHIITLGRRNKEGTIDEKVDYDVVKGDTYSIPNAYIGGNAKWKIGDTGLVNKKLAEEGDLKQAVTLVSSKVSVSILDKDLGLENPTSFVAEKEGVYVVTYSYTYKIGEGEEITNTYKLNVVSSLPKASINFVDTSVPFPSTIDLSLARKKKADGSFESEVVDGKTVYSYINMNLPLPEIHDENDKKVEGVKFFTDKTQAQNEEKYVLISATGGYNSKTIPVSGEGENFYIDGEVFKDQNNAGKYTIKYSYYVRNLDEDGQPTGDPHFVTSATKTTTVNGDSEKSNYYKNYKITMDLESDFVDDGQTGKESTLPKAIGMTTADTTPANEQVDVAYSVRVFYKTTREGRYDTEIKDIKVDATSEDLLYADQLNEDGTLKDPTKFTPLQDGYYSFIYTIRDYYGNEDSNDDYSLEFKGGDSNNGVKDQEAPTAIVYDAFLYDEDDEYVDEAYKAKSYTVANSVVVYAIGMTDKVSKYNTPKVEMYREIVLDEEETVLTINDYDKYNLIFNYRATGDNAAYENLITNDYYIRRRTKDEHITSDKEMLDWLKSNNHRYLIVIDNNNSQAIFDTFNDANVFTDESITDGKSLVAWLKTQKPEDIAALGFAYIDGVTFGSNVERDDLGTDDYVIHYVVKDAAGNESTHRTVSMSIFSTLLDQTAPTIDFPTGLKDSYLPEAKVTFNAPSHKLESFDNRMRVHTLYRYIYDKSVAEKDKVVGEENLNEVWDALTLNEEKDDNGTLLTEKYKDYHSGDDDKYFDITDPDASTYTIDLSEAGDKVTGLQIFVYVFDDAGNVGVYAQTISISSVIDNMAPLFVSVSGGEEGTSFEQGSEITLPTLEFRDDAVGFMSYEIYIEYEQKDGNLRIASTGSYQERNVPNGTFGTYTVHGGEFVASYAGTYHVAIKVSDGKNNTIVYFATYYAEQRNIVQPPVINPSFAKNQTVELDEMKDGIEIPVPTVAYEIPKSVTYDVYSADIKLATDEESEKQKPNEGDTKSKYYDKNSVEYKNTDVVVVGANEKGLATNWTTPYGTESVFKPTWQSEKEKPYDFVFTVDLLVYNYKTDFKYVEMTATVDEDGFPHYEEGGYLSYTNNSVTAKIYGWQDGELKLVCSGNDTKTYIVVNNDDAGFQILNEDRTPFTESEKDYANSIFANGGSDALKDGVKFYRLSSDTYRIVVKDTIAPTLIDYEYPDKLEKDENGKVKGPLEIQSIQWVANAAGIDDIDRDESYIDLSWKLASANETISDHVRYSLTSGNGSPFENQQFDKFPDNCNGTYTIEYVVYDIHHNKSAECTYDIAVGDNVGPTMNFDNFEIQDSYKLDEMIKEPLKVDLTSIEAEDPGSETPSKVQLSATLTNRATGKVIDPNAELSTDDILFFNIEEVGTYSLVITAKDEVGNTTTSTPFVFEVASETRDAYKTYEIVGTILIVISVLILAGVIIYFIVSKVKLDKELKK